MTNESEFATLDAFLDAAPGSPARRALQAELEASPAGRRLLDLHRALHEGPDGWAAFDVSASVMKRIRTMATPTADRAPNGVFDAAAAATVRVTSTARRAPATRPALDAWRTRIRHWFAPRVAPGLPWWRLAFTALALTLVVLLFMPALSALHIDALSGAALRGAGPGWLVVGLGIVAAAALWWLGRGRR